MWLTTISSSTKRDDDYVMLWDRSREDELHSPITIKVRVINMELISDILLDAHKYRIYDYYRRIITRRLKRR